MTFFLTLALAVISVLLLVCAVAIFLCFIICSALAFHNLTVELRSMLDIGQILMHNIFFSFSVARSLIHFCIFVRSVIVNGMVSSQTPNTWHFRRSLR